MRRLEIDYHPNTADRIADLANEAGFIFLDSCYPKTQDGRFDILSASPAISLTTSGECTEIRSADHVIASTDDPFELMNQYLRTRECETSDLPFYGGAMGYFSYDLSRRIERVPTLSFRDIDLPEMFVGIYEWAAVIDHLLEQAWVVAPKDSDEDLAHWASRLDYQAPLTPPAFATSFQVNEHARPEISFARYAEQFAKIKRYIDDGDCYQVNFAQRFSAAVQGQPWDAYCRLRNLNPAPFSAYLNAPGAVIMSSSPERFLKVHNRNVETKPIKGTAPRSDKPGQDKQLAEALRMSEKDRAENVMIVDLMRNDIGRKCEIGSVEVSRLFAIESFAKVHHLVSTVNGRLAHNNQANDLLRACFPGGSITGAPKLRAMEIIEELEPTRRSIYCGSIGYLGFDGGMDTNIAIRTLLYYRERMYCWAGGGIVADSSLQTEYQESLDKASAMLDVFEHAEAQYLDR